MISYHHSPLIKWLSSNVYIFLLGTLLGQAVFANEQLKIVKSPLSRLIRQPTITAIYRDHEGPLWIGTQQGLYRFDGTKFMLFNSVSKNETRIPASDITGIGENPQGSLFVSTFGGGLLKWNRKTNLFESVPKNETFNAEFITSLFASKSGRMWLGTPSGIVLYDPESTRNSRWFRDHILAEAIGQPNAVAENKDGNIFIASNTGLYNISERLKSIERVHFNDNYVLLDTKITALEFDSSGLLFFGTSTGRVVAFNLGSGLAISQRKIDSNTPSSILDLQFYNDGLLIGTDNGLTFSAKDLSLFKSFHDKNSALSNNHTTILYKDNDYIWVGTYQGLNLLSFVPFSTFNGKNSGVFDDVLAFEQDDSGKIWVGTYNGLYFFDYATGLHTRVGVTPGSLTLTDQRIMTIAAKGAQLWLGFRQGGVQIVELDGSSHQNIPDIPNVEELEVTKILHLTSDETWIGTYNRGLFRIKNQQIESFLASKSLTELSITQLFRLNSGELLVGAQNNVYRYNSEQEHFDTIEFHFEGNSQRPIILSINQSNSGELWLGTKDQGLYVWTTANQRKGGTNLLKVGLSDELSSTTIYGIEFDSAGNSWCSTQDGLLKLDSGGNLLDRFTLADGLQGSDFNFGASFTDREGQIYFGGINGYNRFTPRFVKTNLNTPRILLTNIDLAGSKVMPPISVEELQTLQLTHKDYFVVFTFSVLDFLDPEKNQFRYMLENFDPDWIDNGTRNTATYTNLPAGDYVLRVQGANSAGVWNREGISLNVRVLPPPWKSWWAYCIYGVVFLFFLWIFKRVYDGYVIKKHAIQMAIEMHENENRADDDMQEQLELQDDLVKSVYRHNVATLALISDYISRQSDYVSDDLAREAAQGSVKRVAALSVLEGCLYYQNDGLLADLHKYTDILISKLVSDASVRPDTIISINEISTKLIAAEIASPLSIVLYELLENCFQHAFELESPANYIHISLDIEPADSPNERCYRLVVRDNGVGCPGNIHLDEPDTSGLATVHAIAEKLSGSLHTSSDNGTAVTLMFNQTVPE